MIRILFGCVLSCVILSSTCLLHAQGKGESASEMPVPHAVNTGKSPLNAAHGANSQGGRAVQDWSTLMMLISQTVDPDEWRDFGGTGNNTMIPYPNGVWIDAQGQLKRMQKRAIVSPNLQSPAAHQAWMQATGMRTISLKKLDKAICVQHELGLSATHQLQNLAGLSHIEYVLIDRQAQDILLAGPVAQDLSILELEDLCLLLNVMNDHTAPLGCSLDPNDKGLNAAAQFLRQPNTVARLSRSPQIVAEQLRKQVGPHQVNVFGIEPRCSTALALVTADELMKRYGLGLSKGSVPLKTYFDQLNRTKSVQPQSLIRWWFAYTDQPVLANPDNALFQMPKQAAMVMSQQQWIAASGQRVATGGTDPAADAFAHEFTDKFASIAASEPVFARLEGIFELGLALQVAIDGSQQTSLHAWFPSLCQEAEVICVTERAPKSVEGVTAYDRLSNGTVVAVISGGVTLDPVHGFASHRVSSQAIATPAQLKQTTSSESWWWD